MMMSAAYLLEGYCFILQMLSTRGKSEAFKEGVAVARLDGLWIAQMPEST
jgi:hypothetical protein